MEKKKLNLFQKLQQARVELQEMNLKKSGHNKFAGFTYYTLEDFLPAINIICNNVGLFTAISFDKEYATLRIYDTDDIDKFIEYKSPMKEIEQKGCNAIQNLGSVQSYSRRYLYLSAFEIVENDFSDAVLGKDDNKRISSNNITNGTKSQINILAKQYAELAEKTMDDVMNVLSEKYQFATLETLTDDVGQSMCKQLNNWIMLQKKKNKEKENASA
jgi:hypothetical protein